MSGSGDTCYGQIADAGGAYLWADSDSRQSLPLDFEAVYEKAHDADFWLTMRNEWQTSILLNGHLYGMDNVGGAGPITNLNCVDIATGKRVWQDRRFGKGNLIAADGKLWISTMKGELVVVRATPKGFDELGRAKVIDGTRQAPSLAGGMLYLRDNSQVVCLDVRIN